MPPGPVFFPSPAPLGRGERLTCGCGPAPCASAFDWAAAVDVLVTDELRRGIVPPCRSPCGPPSPPPFRRAQISDDGNTTSNGWLIRKAPHVARVHLPSRHEREQIQWTALPCPWPPRQHPLLRPFLLLAAPPSTSAHPPDATHPPRGREQRPPNPSDGRAQHRCVE